MFRRLPPGNFRRVLRPPTAAGFAAVFRGDEEVGESGDVAKDRWEKGNGRRGKKMTEERGKKEDDGRRKKKIDGDENRYI